jgi:tetratricopeptide (TPR) repeat protein
MEQRGDRTGEVVGLIADHLELAGEHDAALRYLRRAGEEAAKKYANDEAVDYFSRALELVSEDDLETRFKLLLEREDVLNLQAKRNAQNLDLEALETLAKHIGSIEKQMEVTLRWSFFHFITQDYTSAAKEAERVVSQANASGNLHLAATAELSWGRALIWQFQYEVARQHLQLALDGFRATGDQHQESTTLRSLGSVAAGLHDLQAWQDYAQQALSIARQIGDRVQEAEAINHLGYAAFRIGDYLTAKEYFTKYSTLTSKTGNKLQESQAFGYLGSVAIAGKEYMAARGYYERSLAIAQTIGYRAQQGESLIGLGDAFTGLEKWDKASQAYLKALGVYRGYGAEEGVTVSRVGLTEVALAKGDMQGAQVNADAILDYLEGDIRKGHYLRPTKCYLVCLKVLQATGDLRAKGVLERGYAELHGRAAKITDEALRRSFLENVPWRRELVRLWEKQQTKHG